MRSRRWWLDEETLTLLIDAPSDQWNLFSRAFRATPRYGEDIKALIEEEFGDGIMSAIDFRMDLQREPDPKGDRVSITMSGKFLPYKTY